MRSFSLILFCFISTLCFSQKETSHWFVSGSRMNVVPGGITNNLSTSVLYPNGGSTSVSDSAGNLLFVSDGKGIYNKNVVLMPGLTNVTLNSTDKLLAAHVPGTSRYLLFYASPNTWLRNASSTLRYAVIDLSLQGGLGDVVSYDNVIDTALSRSFTLVKAANSNDTWLVTHRKETTTFRCYKISATGLNTTPAISNAGTLTFPQDYIFHELKTSHNGKLIAGIAYRDYTNIFAMTWGAIEVFHFDPLTGSLSSKVRTSRGSGYYTNFFSLEFSPDDRLLYAGYMQRIYGLQPCGWGAGKVLQYNLCYTDTTSFTQLSMSVASTFSFCAPGASWGRIQLGANKKLLMPYSGNVVSALHHPNRIGSYINYQFDAHQVLTSNNQTIIAPTFHHQALAKAVINNIVYDGGCYPSPISFRITNDTISTVEWNFGDPSTGAANISALPAPQHQFSAPGFYNVTAKIYTTNGALIDTLSELVEIKDPNRRLLADYPTDTTICANQTLKLKLNVVNGIFRWSRRLFNSSQAYDVFVGDSITSNGSGVYYVEMRQNDCNGCTMIDSIRLTVLPMPYVDLGPNKTLCTGDSLRLSGSDPAATYIWNTGETTQAIWVLNGGTYWVQGELDNNGCPLRDTIVITSVPGVQFALPSDTTLCNNQTLTLSPGISGASYLWQNNSTQPTFTVTNQGTYWVRVTASNGCHRSDTVKVSYVNAQAVSLGRDTSLCEGASLPLSVVLPNAIYMWSTGSTAGNIVVTQTGSYWVRVTAGGCTTTDTINVVFQSPPVFSLGRDTTICEKQSLTLRTRIVGATHLWSNGSITDTLAVTAPGQYWVAVTRNGCTTTDTINITHKPVPLINLGRDTALCSGNLLQISAYHPSIQSYYWQNNNSLPAITVQAPGIYWVQVTGINGCSNSDTIVVSYKALPQFTLGNDTLLCEGHPVQYAFSLTGAGYVWSNGSTGAALQIEQAGTYWLEVQQNGCSKRDSVTVTYTPLPTVNLGKDSTLCGGQFLLLDASNTGAVYRWSNGETTAAIRVTEPGQYWVKVIRAGCNATDTIQVAYNYRPMFSLGKDTLLCKGHSFTINGTGTGASQYLWQDGSTLQTYLVKDTGTYRLTITNDCGAASDDIKVISGVCALQMPTAFTPNRDGRNDVFGVLHPQFIKAFKMQVFNRWGEVVYSSTDPYRSWDGRVRGIEQSTGNYVWFISLTDHDGRNSVHKGSVMLIR